MFIYFFVEIYDETTHYVKHVKLKQRQKKCWIEKKKLIWWMKKIWNKSNWNNDKKNIELIKKSKMIWWIRKIWNILNWNDNKKILYWLKKIK